jgi:hypothetical protein
MFRFAQHDSVMFSREQSRLLKIVDYSAVKATPLTELRHTLLL